jgi:hypothetical protein
MVEALRKAGFHTKTGKLVPRTTIICRTGQDVEDDRVLNVISATLLEKGFAVVVRVGGDRIHIGPDEPWPGEEEKRSGGTTG